MSLPPEQTAAYGVIIDDILANSNLASVSAKQVRKQLTEKLGYDISDQKKAVNEIINERFDKLNNQQNGIEIPNNHAEPPPTANGIVRSIEQPPTTQSPEHVGAGALQAPSNSPPKRSAPDDDSELSELADDPKPAKKRKHATAEDDDAAFAARLQDEENRLARPTRGGATRKRAPVKKDKNGIKKKKKSAARIKEADDSDVESGAEDKKEKKGGFHKPMLLSEALSALVGETELSRPQTVKKVWEYIKSHDLQDPNDRRQIICDDMMTRVFKQEKVHMFTMNKILNQQLYPKDE